MTSLALGHLIIPRAFCCPCYFVTLLFQFGTFHIHYFDLFVYDLYFSLTNLLLLSVFILLIFHYVCTLVSQVASFSGWECVECGQKLLPSSKICKKCDADKLEIAGAVHDTIIL